MADFRKLQVFDKAHRLTLDVYAATRRYPRSETFALTSQTCRAASSICANLAEGAGRDSDRELARFARIALGSASELEYHLLLAHDLGLLPAEEWSDLSTRTREVQRMLAALARSLSTPAAN